MTSRERSIYISHMNGIADGYKNNFCFFEIPTQFKVDQNILRYVIFAVFARPLASFADVFCVCPILRPSPEATRPPVKNKDVRKILPKY